MNSLVGGVAVIPDLQKKLIKLGRNGFRHHTLTGEATCFVVERGLCTYLKYDILNCN